MLVEYMAQIRHINKKESKIVQYLTKLANYPFVLNNEILVMSQNDSGMGSFTIFQNGNDKMKNRKFGRRISEYEFIDDDNIPVLVSLNVDEDDGLFEVDIWKANYSPVINLKIP